MCVSSLPNRSVERGGRVGRDDRTLSLEGYHWVAVLSQKSVAGQRQRQQQQGLPLSGSMTQSKERITGWICA